MGEAEEGLDVGDVLLLGTDLVWVVVAEALEHDGVVGGVLEGLGEEINNGYVDLGNGKSLGQQIVGHAGRLLAHPPVHPQDPAQQRQQLRVRRAKPVNLS